MSCAIWSSFLFATLLLTVSVPAYADEKASTEKGSACAKPLWRDLSYSRTELEIEAKLKQPVQFTFNGDRLGEVISFVQDVYEVPLWIHHDAIAEEGIDFASETVELSLENYPLHYALDLLLEKEVGSLTWCIERDMLVITTMTQLDTNMESRLYDVTGLKAEGYSPEVLAATIEKTAGDDSGELIVQRFDNAILITGTKTLHRELPELFGMFARQACPDMEKPAAETVSETSASEQPATQRPTPVADE